MNVYGHYIWTYFVYNYIYLSQQTVMTLKNENYKQLLTETPFSHSLPLSFSISLSFLSLSFSLSQNQIESEMKIKSYN